MPPRRRLLTIGHSYVVALNRRLAHEMSRSSEQWEITCAAPLRYHGDLGPVRLSVAAGEPCRVVGLSAFLTRKVHLFVYGAGLRRLLSEGWDAIYAWEEPYVAAGYQLASWAPRRPVLACFTAQNIQKRYPPPFSHFERRTLARVDGWLPCGHSVQEALKDRPGYRDRPSAVVPLGVDTTVFRPDAELRRGALQRLGWSADGPPIVGFSGRFVEEKGTRLLCNALDRLQPNFRALFLGGGPLEGYLRSWAKKCGDRVRVVRAVHDEVPLYLNAMDVACAPSQTTPAWAEQFGRVLVEAFACGVPVVASHSGEIPYVVADAGILVGEGDDTALSQALASLLGSASERARLGALGLERARREYAWPVVAQRCLGFFEQLLANRNGA